MSRSYAVGYARLISTWDLNPLPLGQIAKIDGRTRHREIHSEGTIEVLTFEAKYAPKEDLVGDLQFALRYEGVNLQVLELLFTRTGARPLIEWLESTPRSAYARRAGFLYEWITGDTLAVKPLSSKVDYVSVLDESLQFGLGLTSDLNQKFRIRNNLPGTPQFCPLVRKTSAIRTLIEQDLATKISQTLANHDPNLLKRASQYLYLKETSSSFEVERERPSSTRTQLFVELLRRAPSGKPISQEGLAEAQNSIIEPRFHEFAYRSKQNWIGGHYHYRETVSLVPPRPADVLPLMQGLCALSERGRLASQNGNEVDPVVHAASVAFGFVFIHPFLDGNGRLHRYLIHEELSTLKFTPPGIALPISAFILANLDMYVDVLEQFSKPLVARTDFVPESPELPAKGNDPIYFRFFDATAQALFLYRAIERTASHDLQNEINFLIGVDRARAALKDEIDWPAQSLDLFINVVHQNKGVLSKTKRDSHFAWLTEDERARFVAAVNEAFNPTVVN